MKNFLHKIVAFIAIMTFILVGVFLVNRNWANFKISDKNNILLVGHSHSECAFNDTIVSGLINYSQSGESYFYTYFKVKKLISQNPHINKILIEFSNNQIDQHMDDWIWDDKYLSYRFPKYASFMDLQSLQFLREKNPNCFKQSLPVVVKNNVTMLLKQLNYTKEIGGYLYLERNKTDSILKSRSFEKEILDEFQEVSVHNLAYLHKIIDFCQQNDVAVFLIRSPLHAQYYGYQNEPTFQDLLVTDFSNVSFLDFSKFPLENKEFGDLQHLNHFGATKFSKWFSNLMASGLFEKTDKQNFIDQEINSLKQEKIQKEVQF